MATWWPRSNRRNRNRWPLIGCLTSWQVSGACQNWINRLWERSPGSWELLYDLQSPGRLSMSYSSRAILRAWCPSKYIYSSGSGFAVRRYIDTQVKKAFEQNAAGSRYIIFDRLDADFVSGEKSHCGLLSIHDLHNLVNSLLFVAMIWYSRCRCLWCCCLLVWSLMLMLSRLPIFACFQCSCIALLSSCCNRRHCCYLY